MSRSYKKRLRMHSCTGSNTEWYRARRRMKRRRDRNHMRYMLANNDIDTVSENLIFEHMPKSDTWNEPTDGSWSISYADVIRRYNDSLHDTGRFGGLRREFWKLQMHKLKH